MERELPLKADNGLREFGGLDDALFGNSQVQRAEVAQSLTRSKHVEGDEFHIIKVLQN